MGHNTRFSEQYTVLNYVQYFLECKTHFSRFKVPKKQFAPRKYILWHMNCLGCFTSPRGSFEPTTYSYKLLYCTPSALSITPRIFHWDTNIERYMFSEWYATWVCGSSISILSWLQFHIFWDDKRVFLGLQCVFFWAICQTCFSEIAMHVFFELYTI